MTGKTHFAGGVVAAALLHAAPALAAHYLPAAVPYLPTGTMNIEGMLLPVVVPGAAVAIVAALLPDIDEPESLISNSPNAIRKKLGRGRTVAERSAHQSAGLLLRVANVLTRGLAMLVRLLAGGHRAATHVLPIAAALSVGMYFLGASIGFPSMWMWFALGYLSHLALDMMTISGVAMLWPLSRRNLHLLPTFMRVRTGSGGDAVVRTILYAVSAALLAFPLVGR